MPGRLLLLKGHTLGEFVYRWMDNINTDHEEIVPVPVDPINVFVSTQRLAAAF